ncbi:MAG: Mg2+/Co2+ transporter CorB [Candidatus Deianiraeaceae bacterium]|jgi:Mg2+/Co2+ transporter CorB
MYPPLVYQLILLFVLLVASGFFSASETTFTSCSPSKFYKLPRTRRVRRLLILFDKKESLISFILFGNNAVNIFASSLATYIAIKYLSHNPLFGKYAVEISATIMTFTILIFSEIIPKTIAIRNPERIVFIITDIYFVLLKIFYPLIWFINLITRFALRAVGVHESKQYEAMTAKDSLRSEIEFYHSKGSVIQRDKEMLGGVLDLSEIKLHCVITHRKDIDMLDFNSTTVEEIEKTCIESNHTRIPVYSEDPDSIIGILHFRDLFTLKSFNANITIEDIKGILMKPQYASGETTLLTQLTEFKKTKTHMAIVVDEYGSMIGIVTLEDIVEEIVGDIEDEHDEENDDDCKIEQQSNGDYIVDGGTLIRNFTRNTNIELEQADGISTIAGLIIHSMHKIPKKGDIVNIDGVSFEIISADVHKVKKVKIKKLPPSEED